MSVEDGEWGGDGRGGGGGVEEEEKVEEREEGRVEGEGRWWVRESGEVIG